MLQSICLKGNLSNQPLGIFVIKQLKPLAMLLILISSLTSVRESLAQEASSLPEGAVGQHYEIRLQAEGGSPPFSWRVAEGELPPGLNLESSGRLTGQPTVAQERPYEFTVELTDSSPQPQRHVQRFAILIRSSLRITAPLRVSPARHTTPPAPSPTLVAESNSDEATISVANRFNPQDVVNVGDATIKNASLLIGRTVLPAESAQIDDYCIVHIVRWVRREDNNRYEAHNDRWYLYRNVDGSGWTRQEQFEGRRIFGSRRVAVLFIHLTAEPSWDIRYRVGIERRTPAPIQNVMDLVGIITARAGRNTNDTDLWGGRLLDIRELPSDIAINGNVIFMNEGERPNQQAGEFSRTYENEGRYRWDVSVGLPIRGVRELQYNADDGTVRTRAVERQNAYGFLNIFPVPVDVRGDDFLRSPHFVLGVPISGRPLDRPVIGLGYGINRFRVNFDFFAGVVFNRVREPRVLRPGDPASQSQLESDLRSRRVGKFIFGINLPIRQVIEALDPDQE
jgi:hypothetical protein